MNDDFKNAPITWAFAKRCETEGRWASEALEVMESLEEQGYKMRGLLFLARKEFERRDGAGTCPTEIEQFLFPDRK